MHHRSLCSSTMLYAIHLADAQQPTRRRRHSQLGDALPDPNAATRPFTRRRGGRYRCSCPTLRLPSSCRCRAAAPIAARRRRVATLAAHLKAVPRRAAPALRCCRAWLAPPPLLLPPQHRQAERDSRLERTLLHSQPPHSAAAAAAAAAAATQQQQQTSTSSISNVAHTPAR
jgi:hypothetical protein